MKRFFTISVLFLSMFSIARGEEDFYQIERSTAISGFDGKTCWVHARAGAIPAEVAGENSSEPLVVMTLQKLLLSGSDLFYELHEMRTDDLGVTWTEPVPQEAFKRQTVPASDQNQSLPKGAEIAPQLLQPGDQTTVCDFTPMWNSATQRLLGIGQTVWYRNGRVMHTRPRGIAYAVYDQKSNGWNPWKVISLPDEKKFQSAGSGSAQRVDLPGGDVLIPCYFKEPEQTQYSVTIIRCRFDGETLNYVEHGNELTIPVKRGLYEPSLTKFQGKYFLTMRNDEAGYVSTSSDGLHFEPERKWTYDDGSDLGNYNTQQHWVTHHEKLFLVYTRRGAENDHVFRHRAPLFITEVDPEKLHVIRATEQILVPERGARLGNFGVVDVSPEETWVTVTEWMQPIGVEKYGSYNSLFVAKLKWKDPNQLVSETIQEDKQSAGELIKPYFQPPAKFQSQFGKYQSPLVRPDGSRVKTPEQWQERRKEIKSEWEQMLGQWPPLITEPVVEYLSSTKRENFTEHRIRFFWTPTEMTTGYLLIPEGAGPHPAVISVFYEPETAIGKGKPNRDFSLQLARRGIASLSIGTTEASQAGTYSLYYPDLEHATVQPLSMLAYAAANAWYVLASHEQIDSKRIGIVGHSFGGKWAMFAACLFDKFACAAWSDPGIVFDNTRPSINYWEPWYLGYHPKPWRKRGLITEENPAQGLYPELMKSGHDLHELHALMAPRPVLVSGGAEDPLERWTALNHLVEVNRLLGYENRVAMTNRPDHSPNADSNEIIYTFFQHFLQPSLIE
ncbi:prolyl oligopeptidase family serine peptidase [Rubinisphaera sp.]|uniref:prolyl oligopeptidase family serine peptidase n=1 Tax=Rubinisphaera sp. TaxID=2024857 RepID=UPI0025F7BCDE|nr:prolyl oligopeptidase family serine peptidase [Rubinisphaera sp.]